MPNIFSFLLFVAIVVAAALTLMGRMAWKYFAAVLVLCAIIYIAFYYFLASR